MLNWLKKAARWTLGKEKKKEQKRDILAPTARTKMVTKKLKDAGLTDEEISRLTGVKATKALERKARE